MLEQNHKPLAFLGGRFTGAATRWATIEKKAFAIVEVMRRVEYLPLRPEGYRLFTNHHNLIYTFCHGASDGVVVRYHADKMQRQALSMNSFKNIIEHVPGESNVRGDLLSRWGAGPSFAEERGAPRVARLAVVERVSPLEDPEFAWPREVEIRESKERAIVNSEVPVDGSTAMDE